MTLKTHKTIRVVAGVTLIAVFTFFLFVVLPLSHLSLLGEMPAGFPVGEGFLRAILFVPVIASLSLFPYAYYAGWVSSRESAMRTRAGTVRERRARE